MFNLFFEKRNFAPNLLKKIIHMNCPRCKSRLKNKTIVEPNDKFEIETCPTCEGYWFDKSELNILENISEPVLFEWRMLCTKYDQLTPLNCPSCGDHPMMKKAEHPRDEKVVIDYCEHCEGTWLDGGELDAIQKENWSITIFNLLKKLK